MNTARTSLFLMANLGAEVSRIIEAHERGNEDSATRAALLRAENILSKIAYLPDMKTRAQELDALACALRSFAAGDSHAVSAAHLKSSFMPFALRLMTTR